MSERALVYVVDDDADLAATLSRLLQRNGHTSLPFSCPEIMLSSYEAGSGTCILADIMMGPANGFALAEKIRAIDASAAFVFMTAWPSTADAVDAIRRHGGLDYLEKPIDEQRLLAAVEEGLQWSARKKLSMDRVQRLTRREREVFDQLVQGLSNKAVAARLQVSPKTVEDHRAAIMLKTGAESLAELIGISRAFAPIEMTGRPN
ncbi:MAG: two-component system response regulator [Alphaproteobacteria bacterium]|nr:two-component system response regulator [Alphaproteobacteria bacterium]